MTQLSKLETLAVSETGFVFEPTTGATFTLNAPGLAVLRALREGLGREEIVGRLREHFEGVGNTASDDIAAFIQMLRQHNLIQSEFKL